VAKTRALDINPKVMVNCYQCFYLPENAEQFDFSQYDYVADAIDTVSGKIALIEQAHKAGTPIISAMGAGNKLDAAAFEVADISKTSVCPLAKVVRKALRERGIEHSKVVYSKEPPCKPTVCANEDGKRPTTGSVSFVPPVVGLLIASEIIKDLLK